MPTEAVKVFFHGYYHGKENLQDNPVKIANLRNTFQGTSGIKIFFDESAQTTPETAEKIKQAVEEVGFAAYYIAGDIHARTGRMPSMPDVVRKAEELAVATPNEIIEEALVHPRILSRYLLGRELDALRRTTPFDFDMEYHAPKVIQNNLDLLTRGQANKKRAVESWTRRDIHGVVSGYREAMRLRTAAAKVRDDDTRGRLKELVGKWLKRNPDSALFLNYGAAHIILADNLRKNVKNDAVRFDQYISPDMERFIHMYRGIGNKDPIPDRDYLARFGHECTLDEITYQRQVWNPRLVLGFTDFSLQVGTFWQSLEQAEFEEAVSSGSFVDFMLRHPQGQSLQDYL